MSVNTHTGSGKENQVSDWPIVQAGDLPTVLSAVRTASGSGTHWTGKADGVPPVEGIGPLAIPTASPIPQPTAGRVQPPAPPKPLR